MFLSARQLDGLAELAVEGRDDITTFFKDKDNKARAKQIANARHSVDIALFGRMVADGADINVDAATQVAHALSVHQVENESDYYTAVDDHKEREDDDLGAGMIGTVEFNSATLYRYAALDVDQLRGNLGKGLRDDEPVPSPSAAPWRRSCRASSPPCPPGRSTPSATTPSRTRSWSRSARPARSASSPRSKSPASATANGGHLQAAWLAWPATSRRSSAYGTGSDAPDWVLRVGTNTDPLAELGTEVSLPELVSAVGEEVAGGRSTGMSVLAMQLAGPLQAWGASARFARRTTETRPPRAASIGLSPPPWRPHRDDLTDLAALRFGVRIDQRGTPSGTTRSRTTSRPAKSMPVSERFYLADAVFVAAVEGAEPI